MYNNYCWTHNLQFEIKMFRELSLKNAVVPSVDWEENTTITKEKRTRCLLTRNVVVRHIISIGVGRSVYQTKDQEISVSTFFKFKTKISNIISSIYRISFRTSRSWYKNQRGDWYVPFKNRCNFSYFIGVGPIPGN